jgi:hypothetical protein
MRSSGNFALGTSDEAVCCKRCRRIKSAIEQGLSPHAAREENGWDECSRDDCPMLLRPYRLKTYSGGGVGRAA